MYNCMYYNIWYAYINYKLGHPHTSHFMSPSTIIKTVGERAIAADQERRHWDERERERERERAVEREMQRNIFYIVLALY